MRIFTLTLATCLISLAHCVSAQVIDVDYNFQDTEDENFNKKKVKVMPKRSSTKTPQLLTSGAVNYMTNGAIQASANLLRLNIGEPDKFYIPFYIYTGATGSGLGDNPPSATSISNLLNPIAGTLNMSFNGLVRLTKGKGYTYAKLTYQAGGRVTSGRDSLTQKNFTYFNVLANAGLYFQTQAWKHDDRDNMGMFFIMVKAISSISGRENYQRILGDHTFSNNVLLGYSVDGGIEIDKVIDMKLGIYQFVNNDVAGLLKKPTVSFTLNYSFN